jgi:hypothetical protein
MRELRSNQVTTVYYSLVSFLHVEINCSGGCAEGGSRGGSMKTRASSLEGYDDECLDSPSKRRKNC